MVKETSQIRKMPTMKQVEAERKRLQFRAACAMGLKKGLYRLVQLGAAALLLSYLFFPLTRVSGTEMEPMLRQGDVVLLMKTNRLETGELFAFEWNNQTMVRRVIACPGDRLSINSLGQVILNGELLREPYISRLSLGDCDQLFPMIIPEQSYFAMGDQRQTALDSRSRQMGCVTDDRIVGKAIFRLWPLSDFGLIAP